jgi:hypothetical protein
MAKRIKYVPPPPEVVRRYAIGVCQKLGEEGDVSFSTSEVVQGFSEFMSVLVRIQERLLNRQQGSESLDNGTREG